MNAEEFRMDRRRFLGGAAGVAGAAALASWAPRALSKPGGPNAPIVFRESLIAQHFSVRDATTRVPSRINGVANPNAQIGNPAAGTITSAGSPLLYQRTSRQIQLALKLYF